MYTCLNIEDMGTKIVSMSISCYFFSIFLYPANRYVGLM